MLCWLEWCSDVVRLLCTQVDIGCGTRVVGDTTNDKKISKSVFTHPLSMFEFSYQWAEGRGNLNAHPPDPGFYPQPGPRYHRFKLTKPGNVTFVSAAVLPTAVAVLCIFCWLA